MTDYAELEKRLRETWQACQHATSGMRDWRAHADAVREAADAISALTKQLEEAREALGSLLGYWEDDEHVASDVLHARAILAITHDEARLSRAPSDLAQQRDAEDVLQQKRDGADG